MGQYLISGRGSTNVQVGRVSITNINHFTIFVKEEKQNHDSLQYPRGNSHKIVNEHSQEDIRFLTGHYNAVFFCLTATVIYIERPFPTKNPADETVTYMSNVFFDAGIGGGIRVTIPTAAIPCARNALVTLVFASDTMGNLIACGIYDKPTGGHAYVELGSSIDYLNQLENMIMIFSMLFVPISIGLCLYFKIWHISMVLFNIATIQSILVFAFTVGMLIKSAIELRKNRFQRLAGEKHSKLLKQLSRNA